MKILFTGASSYTGYWFIKELTKAGHEVTATFRKNPQDYEEIRKERVSELQEICKPLIGVSFGDKKFIEAIKSSKWDLFCHHAAEVTNHKSLDYDWVAALKNNTNNLSKVLETLKKQGCNHVIVTGTFFEPDEGGGSDTEGIYPYGLAKGLTWQAFRYFSHINEVYLGKFVIPICFGQMEDPKLVSYLVKKWIVGETPEIKTPKYIRDNIHVTLLAKVYKQFAEEFSKKEESMKINPSGYVESIKDFTQRVAKEMRPRLNIECSLNFADQKVFDEPIKRTNTTLLDHKKLGWDEKKAWDDLAKFFTAHYS